LIATGQEASLSQDSQVYLKEVLKFQLALLIKCQKYTNARKLMEEVSSLLKNHIDAVCVFLKAFKKHIGIYSKLFKDEHKLICEFLVTNFIVKVKTEEKADGILKFNKALQLSLQILYKSWKASLETRNEKYESIVWFNHA
jgi:hypothetical protein